MNIVGVLVLVVVVVFAVLVVIRFSNYEKFVISQQTIFLIFILCQIFKLSPNEVVSSIIPKWRGSHT